jgi:hypothetical protein
VEATYERYWTEFENRRTGRRAWDVYTPYELRTVGTFVRLGWRDRAHALLDFFLGSRRPAAWNQWAEVVARDMRTPRFLGDMPHGWVASDFIGAALDLFAYEREPDRAMVIGAGLPLAWLDGPGVAVRNLRTPYGPLSYSITRTGPRVILRLRARELPPGGFVLRWPGQEAPGPARINGRAAPWREAELSIHDVRATVILDSVR